MRPLTFFAAASLLALATPALAQTSPIPDRYQPHPYVEISPPEWTRDAVI